MEKLSTTKEADLDEGRTGLREAVAIAEFDQAHAAAMEALAGACAFLLVTGNARFEIESRAAALNAPAAGFLVAATAGRGVCDERRRRRRVLFLGRPRCKRGSRGGRLSGETLKEQKARR